MAESILNMGAGVSVSALDERANVSSNDPSDQDMGAR